MRARTRQPVALRLSLLGAALSLGVAISASCGDGGGTTDPGDGTIVRVVVTPASASVAAGETTTFSAEARDGSGNPVSASFSWTSGDASVASVSSGGVVTGVAAGSTSIMATTGNLTGTATVSVTGPGAATLTVSPSEPPSLVVGDTVRFTATVRDAAGAMLPGATVTWESSNSAVASVDAGGLATAVAPGSASITGRSGGATGSVTVTVENRTPVVTISSPSAGASFDNGATVELRGGATDPEDGTLPDSALVWLSSLDGELGNGSAVDRSDLSAGQHTITLRATDSNGDTASAAVGITVGSANEAPTATITSPTDGSSFTQGATIAFRGSGADAEDGTLSGAALVWTSDVDGALGTGISFDRTDLSVGGHTITLTVTDGGGASGSASVGVTVTQDTQLAAMNVDPAADTLAVGATTLIDVRAFNAAGDAVAAPDGLSWTSSDASVAVVGGDGTVTGVAEGVAMIAASAGSLADTAMVGVVGPNGLLAYAYANGSSDAVVSAGQTVTLEVVLDMGRVSSNGDLGAAELSLTYDAGLLTLQGISSGYSGTAVSNTDTAGLVRSAFVSTNTQGSSRISLLTLTFNVSGAAQAGDRARFGLEFTEMPTKTNFDTYPVPVAVGGRVRVGG